MKKLLACLLVIQAGLLMAGCCCHCAKKAHEQNQPVQEQPAQPEQKQ